MSTQTVRCQWIREMTFLLRDREGFPIVEEKERGVNASDLLPLSLAGCLAWDMVTILSKQRQAFTALSVSAESQQDEDPPWRYRRIHLTYRLQGARLDETAIRRAVRLAEDGYCSIYATLKDAVELSSEIVIEPPDE